MLVVPCAPGVVVESSAAAGPGVVFGGAELEAPRPEEGAAGEGSGRSIARVALAH